MQKSYNIYYNLGYWFLFLVVLAIAAFYTSYLSVIFQPTIALIHIHFTLMALWMVTLVAQPFLIKYKKLRVHRMLGKISYLLVPLVLASAFLMMRHGYYRDYKLYTQQASDGIIQLDNDGVLRMIRAMSALPFIWFFLFIIFYGLAIINRKKSSIHARFMLATALALFGPIIDRITFRIDMIASKFPPESVAFFAADLVLAILLWKDYKGKRPTRTLWICLLTYLALQVFYFTITDTVGWQGFVAFVMQPKP